MSINKGYSLIGATVYFIVFILFVAPLYSLFVVFYSYPYVLCFEFNKGTLSKSAASSCTCMEFHLKILWMQVIILSPSATVKKTNLHSSKSLGKHNL